MIGFDYGIKPNFMIIGDIEYPNLIHEGKPLAIGYGKIPYFGLLIEPPFASLIFENEEKGKECFQHFKNWTEGSKDGDAVSLSFIEKNRGGYIVCVYPELNHLIDRCIPKYLQVEVNPLVMMPISFPLSVKKISNYYLFFKQQMKELPFLFCGASKTGELFLNVAIQKRQVHFYKENEIPKNSPESLYPFIKSTKNIKHNFEKKPPSDLPKEIKKRRQTRLKTFFPITMEKLKYHPGFQGARKLLMSKGFEYWQILQAACNIVVSFRVCKEPHFKELDQKSAQIDILKYLLNTFEEPKDPLPPKKLFSIDMLRKQIIADTIELLKYVGIELKDNSIKVLQNNLKKKELLERYE